MKDVTVDLQRYYHPVSALVVYKKEGISGATYVEHFDMDQDGNPVNAHPLTVNEAKQLAKALRVDKRKEPFLKAKGILPTNVLHIDPRLGRVIWFTESANRDLLFIDNLEIPSGKANVPAMVWVADKDSLNVYAMAKSQRPTGDTRLYNAPFFNVYESGNVCLGTVQVGIKDSTSLEEFILRWEQSFFGSYFSHLNTVHEVIRGNAVSLWKKLINSDQAFPTYVLLPSDKGTIKDLIL